MRKILLVASILLNTIAAKSQVQQTWVYSHIAELCDQVVDANGNIYQASRAYSETSNTYATLVIKHDKDGAEIWRRFLPALKVATAITIDAPGNVYVTGAYSNSYFPSGILRIGQELQIYTAKLSSEGVVQWSNIFFGEDGPIYGIPREIGVDQNGFPYVTGVLYTSIPDNEEHVNIEDSATADMVTIKYDATTGNRIWVKQYNGSTPGSGFDEARAMAIDAVGYVYVSGTSQLNGFTDIVTIKYDPSGNEVWVRRYGTSDATYKNDYAGISGLKLDPAGNLIVAGGAIESFQPLGGAQAGIRIILKYTFSGFQLWVRERNVLYFSSGPMITDNANNIIESADGYTKKYNAAGDLLWSYPQDFNDLAVDADNNIYSVRTCLRNDNGLCGDGAYYGFTTRKLSAGGVLAWEKTYSLFANGGVWIDVDANKNVYTSGSEWMSSPSDNQEYYTIRYSQCEISIPSRIEVNTEPDQCGAIVNWAATTSGDCGDIVYQSLSGDTAFTSGSFLRAGHYHLVARSLSSGAEAFFTIYVNDEVTPLITCPTDITVNVNAGVCYATIDPGTATATDNCTVTVRGKRSDGLALTANYPVGVTSIEWVARDAFGNADTCSQTITVVDNVPPTITYASVSKAILTPPNHKMVDVAVNYTVTDNCAYTVSVSVTSDEPATGLNNGDIGPDIVKIDDKHWQLRAERDPKGDGRVYTITITATDGSNNVSTETRTVVVAHNISAPHSGASVKVGSTVNFAGTFWDVPGNKHTAQWIIDEKTIVKGIVTEPSGMKNGSVAGSFKFTSPGVYKLKMNITDQKGITTSTTTNGDLEAIIVVYDPNGGYTYGGGYFASPSGALKTDPMANGDVSYGFTVNYYKSASLPKGETQFEFQLGKFEYNAVNFEYLAISGSKAQFKGTGKIIGGQSGINFIMTVIDGQLDGSGVDKVRMKIYNRNTGEVYYDNQPGASDAANPLTPIGQSSSIVISSNSAYTVTAKAVEQPAIVAASFEVNAYQNPSKSNFTLRVIGSDLNDKIQMQVIDILGRTIEQMMISQNQNIIFGSRYRPGVYYLRVTNGIEQKQLKLIKLSE